MTTMKSAKRANPKRRENATKAAMVAKTEKLTKVVKKAQTESRTL